MRGSPLFRFSIMLLALALCALVLLRVTSSQAHTPSISPSPPQKSLTTSQKIPFQLTLSAPATSVALDAGLTPTQFTSPTSPIYQSIEIDPKNPHISLIIKWLKPCPPGEHRFAKLTLEPPSRPAFQHVFDATTDIDQFLELPLTLFP